MSKNEIQNAIFCPYCDGIIVSPDTHEHIELHPDHSADDDETKEEEE